MLALWFLAAPVLGAFGQDAPPDQTEQEAIVTRMREAALAYEDRLQDFICRQRTTRDAGPSATGPNWKRLESQELELIYAGHKEHYRLLSVNGQSTSKTAGDLAKRIKHGPYFTPSGEFGSGLRKIFDPKANAAFEWDHEENSAGRRTCVFRYRVQEASSTLVMQVNSDHLRMGHRGTVWADCDTGSILRFQTETDPAHVIIHGRIVPIAERLDLRYAAQRIAAQEFLLPESAVETALFYKTWTKAEIQFGDYRKYDASSSISFDHP